MTDAPKRRTPGAAILAAALMIAALAPAGAQSWPSEKPEPLPGPGVPAYQAPQAAPQGGGGRCAEPLQAGCMRMQSSCQLACPGMWSMNPNAPAFTPTDRAGCMRDCSTRYRQCLVTYGCL